MNDFESKCRNFGILLSPRFEVKSISRIVARISKTAILTILVALNSDFDEFLQFLRTEIYQKSNSEPLKLQKGQIFNFYNPQN